MTESHAFDTRCIHAGEAPEPTTGAHGVPLYQNVTFAFETHGQVAAMRSGERPHFTYSPRGNPTVRCLEVKLASLEGAETSLALNSGMAAISSTLLSVADNGGHVIASERLYELTRAFLEEELPRLGASATFVDLTDLNAIEAAITPNTRAIYTEPFSNPTLAVVDPARLAVIARNHGLTLIVDNTFLSPALYRPIEHGADIVVHSATKYLSGHGQVQGGMISGSRRLVDPIRHRALLLGNGLSPFAAWILLSGIHTLPLRMARHGENAMALARLLAASDAVEIVNYPGLATHPGHANAVRMVGNHEHRFGGMLSFRLTGGSAAVAPFIDALRLCTIAVSLGDCSTLVWPWQSGDLIRVSAGLEDPKDLLRDFETALMAVEHHARGGLKPGIWWSSP